MDNTQPTIVYDDNVPPYPNYKYVVISAIPKNYIIWNIGHHAPNGYLPLCELMPNSEWEINPLTLKAYPCNDAQTILKAIPKIRQTPNERLEITLENWLQENPDPNTYGYKQIMDALPFAKQLIYE